MRHGGAGVWDGPVEGARIDIGAAERQAVEPETIFDDGFETPLVSGRAAPERGASR